MLIQIFFFLSLVPNSCSIFVLVFCADVVLLCVLWFFFSYDMTRIKKTISLHCLLLSIFPILSSLFSNRHSFFVFFFFSLRQTLWNENRFVYITQKCKYEKVLILCLFVVFLSFAFLLFTLCTLHSLLCLCCVCCRASCI